jgi:hypothetical protein
MRLVSVHRFGLVIALATAPAVALAQNGIVPNAAYAIASPPSNPMDQSTADAELTPEESAAITNALSGDLQGTSATPIKPLRLPRLNVQKGLDASRTD